MIRIIKPGLPPEEKKYTATCNTCGCQYEFQMKDARFIPGSFRDGPALITPCPTCKRESWTDIEAAERRGKC